MNHVIKIKARPNQSVRFLGICVHCNKPAATFEFTNETFAERFKKLNESLLMET